MKLANFSFFLSLCVLVAVVANPTLSAAAATHFSVSAPASDTAGNNFSITVKALDSTNQVVTTYPGTVHFTSSDAKAVLPADSHLNNGVGTFTVTLKTTGTRTITATDTSNSTITGKATVAVMAAAATHYSLSAPSNVTVGVSFSSTLKALDAFGNVATGYTGTVHFTSTDPLAVLPANSALVAGSKAFLVTFKTKGSQTLTATDTVTATIKGSVSRSVVYRMVGFRDNSTSPFAAQFNADVPGSAALNTVAGAALLTTLGTNGHVVYNVPSSSSSLGASEIGVYIKGARRVIIANTPGHFYRYMGSTSTGRIIYWDSTSSTSFDIHSTNLNGGDNRLLLAACEAQPNYRVSAKGVLIACPIGTNAPVWASDGLANPVNLPGTLSNVLLQDYFPEGAILSSGGILYHEPVDGTATGPMALSPEPTDLGDTYYTGIVGTGDRVFIASKTPDTAAYHLWALGADGSFAWFTPKKCGTTPSVFPTSPDGVHFMALCPDAAGSGHNYIYRLNMTDENDVLQLTPLANNDSEGHIMADGNMIVRASGAQWRFVPANATGLPASPQTTINPVGPTSSFVGPLGAWMIFNDQSGVHNLVSVNEDMIHVAFLSNTCANVLRAVFTATHIAFLDTSGGVHLAAPDGSIVTTLDATPSRDIQFAGVEPGGREFWVVTHATGEKDTIAWDPVAGVQVMLGGPTSDAGYLVP